MCRLRHRDSKTTPTQQYQTATALRHPIVSYLEHLIGKVITRRMESPPEFPVNLSSSKPRNVLQHDRPRSKILCEPSQLEHQLIPRIVSLVSSTKARETLTRRTSSQKVDFSSIDPPNNVLMV